MEDISTRSGLKLIVEQRAVDQNLELVLRTTGRPECVLHWGLRQARKPDWQLPPRSVWPEGTNAVGTSAAQTPFSTQNGESLILLRLDQNDYNMLEFALFYQKGGRWDNNGGRNYQIPIEGPQRERVAVEPALKELIGQEPVCFEQFFDLKELGQLAAAVTKSAQRYRVRILTDIPGPLILHWGVAHDSPTEWLLPPVAAHPPETIVQQNTAETPFTWQDGLNRLEIQFDEEQAPLGIQFVLKEGDSGGWTKNGGQNFFVRIDPNRQIAALRGLDLGGLGGLAQKIIEAEMGDHGWTLMHRFNLCYDLLDQRPVIEREAAPLEGLALLFVWLRFSAIRQLTWQRNYNTQPRELSHAEERLTQKLASRYNQEPASRPWVRLILPTVGRGGEGQKVRDEILNIMHRHHIKEVSGHFYEEWHQKLHNNTTPDDIVICEALLEFLRSDGQVDLFYKVLQDNGVTRERLRSFERPIKSDPTFHAHLKMGLLHDFEYFLKILKSVHAGADLETAIAVAKGQLDGDTQNILSFVWHHQKDPQVSLVHLVGQITVVRRRLEQLLSSRPDPRDLLYLDLALEQLVRAVVEKNIHLRLPGDQLVELLARVLENLILSEPDAELAVCSRHWERLKSLSQFKQGWSLHAKAVLDRIARALGRSIDANYKLLQPKAELLGKAFKAEPWTVTLFSEEVVRGNSLGFVLSMLLHHLDPLLRKAARLGDWQIISRGQGRGTIEVVESLRSVQGKTYHRPTVVIADLVSGDEEIPPGVVAVIAPDVTDIVSHVAVRARNANLLFASCYDPEVLKHLKSLQGRQLSVEMNPAGDVMFQEVAGEISEVSSRAAPKARTLRASPPFSTYALVLKEFNEALVGKKSFNQLVLRDKLPPSILQPKSVALPFGAFEKVLSLEPNKTIADGSQRLIAQIRNSNGADAIVVPLLAELRQILLGLAAPDELVAGLRRVMDVSGLRWPENWEEAWMRIKQVWASKWNDRAYWSRQAAGIAHEDLSMAVLIQEVVEAEYAFVIHTANPINGNRDEIFAELVLGLGETLVGNYPGRALSLICDKRTGNKSVLAYPGKSVALYGRGLIFRSDSNGEDLTDYAGAGLYDSVLLHPPRESLLDYTQEPLVWDSAFQKKLFDSIAGIGLEVERAFGSPQDIEGAFVNGQGYVVQSRPQVQVQ